MTLPPSLAPAYVWRERSATHPPGTRNGEHAVGTAHPDGPRKPIATCQLLGRQISLHLHRGQEHRPPRSNSARFWTSHAERESSPSRAIGSGCSAQGSPAPDRADHEEGARTKAAIQGGADSAPTAAPPARALIPMAADTGFARRSELASLRWRRIDVDKGQVFVEASSTKNGMESVAGLPPGGGGTGEATRNGEGALAASPSSGSCGRTRESPERAGPRRRPIERRGNAAKPSLLTYRSRNFYSNIHGMRASLGADLQRIDVPLALTQNVLRPSLDREPPHALPTARSRRRRESASRTTASPSRLIPMSSACRRSLASPSSRSASGTRRPSSCPGTSAAATPPLPSASSGPSFSGGPAHGHSGQYRAREPQEAGKPRGERIARPPRGPFSWCPL